MDSSLAFLVVEDDNAVRPHLVRILAAHGKVDAAGTCSSARHSLRSRTYDAIVLDVRLPDGSGLDLLEVAKDRSPAAVVLVLTGSTEHAVIDRALASGARYLLKPWQAKHLVLVAEEARGRRTAATRRVQSTLERWAKAHELSSTEVELFALGAEGVPRHSLCERRKVRPDTIKKQIQLMLQKTGDASFEHAINRLLRQAVAEPI